MDGRNQFRDRPSFVDGQVLKNRPETLFQPDRR